MTIQQLWTPVERELWEHKTGLLWMPAVLALLLALSFLYLAVANDIGGGTLISDFNGAPKIEFNDGGTHLNADLNSHAEGMALAGNLASQFMLFIIGIINVLLWLPLSIVLLVYAHSTLFDDRKNREILFWRSMPVSETQNVLTKFFVIGVIAPTIVFLLTIACVLLFLLVGMLEVLVGGIGRFADVPLLSSLWLPLKVYGVILFNMLVLLPCIAWMLFASAFARKSPFTVSAVVPLSLAAVDRMANSFLGVDLHVATAFNRYSDLLQIVGPNEGLVFTPDQILTFAIAMLIGGLLVCSTIWLRNHRYEI